MTWKYLLVALVVGIVIGALAMRFGNRKLRRQKALQNKLEKNKAELERYREELINHFSHGAQLLDDVAHNYRQLFQHMEKGFSNLSLEVRTEGNPFRNRLGESEFSNDQFPIQIPRDYSGGTS